MSIHVQYCCKHGRPNCRVHRWDEGTPTNTRETAGLSGVESYIRTCLHIAYSHGFIVLGMLQVQILLSAASEKSIFDPGLVRSLKGGLVVTELI